MNRIPITEPSRPSTLLAVAIADEAAKGLARGVNKPLMRKRTACVPPPTGLIASNTFETGDVKKAVSWMLQPEGTSPVSYFASGSTESRRAGGWNSKMKQSPNPTPTSTNACACQKLGRLAGVAPGPLAFPYEVTTQTPALKPMLATQLRRSAPGCDL